jgi:hypothetical protein
MSGGIDQLRRGYCGCAEFSYDDARAKVGELRSDFSRKPSG